MYSREVHDRRRWTNKGGTFDIVLANAVRASKDMSVTIVVNLDSDNWQSIPELLVHLSKLPFENPVQVAFGSIIASSDRHPYSCLPTDEEKVAQLLASYSAAIEAGFPVKPDVVLGTCVNEREASVIIAPDGGLYDCIAGIGLPEFRVCSIFDPIRTYLAKRAARLGKVPRINAQCEQCSSYPICRGGCAYERFIRFGDMSKTICRGAAIHRLYEDVIASYAERVVQGMEGGP